MSFSFGTPSSAPAASGLTSGFNFGANKPATPGFGLTATSQPSTGLFGSPATSAPAFGAATPGFGATTTPAFGAATPAFGTTATPAFGATTATPGFGATATPAFGATSAAPTFGATTTPSFGSTTAPTLGQSGLGTGGLNFGAGSNTSTAASGLTLGAPSTGLGGLGGFGFNTTTTQSAGLGFFSASTANSFVPPTMLPHQYPESTFIPITQTFQMLPHCSNQSPKPELQRICSSPRPMFKELHPTRDSYRTLAPSCPKLGQMTGMTGAIASTTATPSVGLGGVPPSGSGANNTTADGKTESQKQTKLPNEISTTVDSFKEFVKKQKSLSSEVMRISIKPLHKVSRDAEATLRMALSLSGEVSKARAHSKRLRSSAATALANAESVANTPGSELEGTAPPSYVKDLISELEQQLIVFRRQMDVADKQMQASPKLLTEQELTLGIRRMHESLVALAGRLQAVHTQVEGQKEQYLNLRKYILKDPTNVFDNPSPSTSLDQILRDAEGTRKKTKSSHVTDSHLTSAVLADPRAALGSIQQLAGPTPFSYMGGTFSSFSTPDPSAPSWQPQPQPQPAMSTPYRPTFPAATGDTSGFQLQKPPGKRGKQ